MTVTAASEFFRWLKSAPEETGETADEVSNKEAQQISSAASDEVKPERKEKSEETAEEPVSDVMKFNSEYVL